MKRVRFAPSPTGLAARRERAQRGREPRLRRLVPAAHRRHRCGAQRPGRRGGDPRRSRVARRPVGRGAGAPERAAGASTARPRRALGGDRFGRITLLREDGTATYQLASVVDDIEFGITHVIRGNDHRPNEQLHRELTEALGAEPPEYVHHGLILGEDGRKLSKREFGATVASLRDAGIPAEAVRALPRRARPPEARCPLRPAAHPPARDRGDRGDERRGAGRRGRRAGRGRPRTARRARPDEAREYARQVLEPEPVSLGEEARPTLERFKELSSNGAGAEGRRPRAEGGRRRPARAPARAHRPRARPRALGDRRRAAPRRDTEAGRCGSITPRPASSTSCPRRPAPIRMYFCGPTVYQRIHVGNARPFIVSMWLKRWLERAAATT